MNADSSLDEGRSSGAPQREEVWKEQSPREEKTENEYNVEQVNILL